MPKKYELNQKDIDVYDYIKLNVEKKGFPPTVREICKAMKIKSTSSVHAILSKLEKFNYIQKDPALPRAIKLLKNEDELFKKQDIIEFNRSKAIEVPLLGNVAAGTPLLAMENIQEYFPVPESFTDSSKDVFMLKIQGDSMLNAGILNNDMVLVAKSNTAKNRDIVVALIDDSATVKTFYKEKDHIRLQPENDFYEPIICKDNVDILGRVVGVFRKL